MVKNLLKHGLIVMALTTSAAAVADDRGAYVGVRIGNGMENRFGGDADDVDTDRPYGLYGGWNFHRHWGIELGYTDLGESSYPAITDYGFDVDGRLLNLGASYRYAFSEAFDAFATFGVFELNEDGTVITIAGPRPLNRDDSGVYGELGARYHFNDQFALRASYQWFDFGGVFNDDRDGTPWIGAEFSF